MSRNTMIIVGVAIVAIILLFVVFSGDEVDTMTPATETEVPETEAPEAEATD